MANKWNRLDTPPPYELVEVSDKYGNICLAYPSFYQLHEKNENGNPVWNGGWVIQGQLFMPKEMSKIIKWRLIDD